MSDAYADTATLELAEVSEDTQTEIQADAAATQDVSGLWPKDQMLDRLRTCD